MTLKGGGEFEGISLFVTQNPLLSQSLGISNGNSQCKA